MIVVDTNLIAYFYVASDFTPLADAVRRRDPIWAAPTLWRSEFRNMLVRMIRRRALAPADARRIASQAEQAMAGQEFLPVSHAVLDLAVTSGCAAYDCEFVALALSLGVRLVTSDQQLLRAFPSVAVAAAGFAR